MLGSKRTGRHVTAAARGALLGCATAARAATGGRTIHLAGRARRTRLVIDPGAVVVVIGAPRAYRRGAAAALVHVTPLDEIPGALVLGFHRALSALGLLRRKLTVETTNAT